MRLDPRLADQDLEALKDKLANRAKSRYRRMMFDTKDNEAMRRTIEIKPGRLHMIADDAEAALAEAGWKFSAEGNTVYGSFGGANVGKPIKPAYMRLILSRHIDFVKVDGRMRGLKPCDPPHELLTAVMAQLRTKGSEEAMRLYERARDKVRLVHSSGGQ